MNPQDWEAAGALFTAALDQPSPLREEYVRREAGTPEIAEEVLSLLDAHERRGPFDEITDRSEAEEGSHEIVPGTRFGAWEIVEEIGRAAWASSTASAAPRDRSTRKRR